LAANMPPRYLQYRSAYNFGRQRARGISDESQLHLNGMVNANRLLKIFIFEGGLGVGPLTYTEYYARDWQKANFP
jgi:hypothetical protein